MFLGIEIGGTKLQLGVGSGDGGPFAALQRLPVDPNRGAEGIREQVERAARALIDEHGVTGVGIGFGGPVDAAAGRTITSHQVDGWTDFPLADWCRRTLGLPAALGNDSDLAGLAEARFGAGAGHRVVFYTNVGSGIGGALVIDGQLYGGGCGVASEIGHLRPGLSCEGAGETVESIASGFAIAAAVKARLANDDSAADLLGRCEGKIDRLSTAIIARAAAEGNRLAREALDRACRAYGWAIAQMITLVSPNIVVVGGGVSLVGEALWFAPLREQVARCVFPPLRGSYRIVPAALGEEVVVHGALALAASG